MFATRLSRPPLAGIVIATTMLFSSPALSAEKLYMPYVEKGEWELEYFGSRTNDGDNAKDDAQKHQFSVGYGVNDMWRTELYTKFAKDPEDNVTFDAWEWENIFQLTERGKYWLDVGGSLAYEYTPQSNHADKLEGRLILAKDIGKTFHVLNAIVEKEVGSGPKEEVEGNLVWSSRYNYKSYFEPGFEISSGFGELEHTGNFDDQEHYIGPVAYGQIPIDMANKGDKLGYRIGYLFGVSDAASDGDIVVQLEYETRF